MPKKRITSNRVDSEYFAIYDQIRNDYHLRTWYDITSVNGRAITRDDVDAMRTNISHGNRRETWGKGIKVETQQLWIGETYTFKVRKMRKETA